MFDEDLQVCSTSPITGWYRDGFCKFDAGDRGKHTVCAIFTQEFLEYSKAQGNDLSTPFASFPGLKPGDNWCLCEARWKQANMVGIAPKLNLAATHIASKDQIY